MQQIGIRRSLLYVDGKGTGTGLQYHALTIPIPYPTSKTTLRMPWNNFITKDSCESVTHPFAFYKKTLARSGTKPLELGLCHF